MKPRRGQERFLLLGEVYVTETSRINIQATGKGEERPVLAPHVLAWESSLLVVLRGGQRKQSAGAKG